MGSARDRVLDTIVAETHFLRTELIAGLTFSKIALESKDEVKVERNRANARKAYDALLRFVPAAILSVEESKEIKVKMAELKSDLQELGEDV